MFQTLRHKIRVFRANRREKKKLTERSPKWPAVEHAFRKDHPACVACHGIDHVQVHHKQPFHLHPELELEPSNLISLCMGPNECHLVIGHGDSFRCWNPNVEKDAAAFAAADTVKRVEIQKQVKLQRKK